MTSIASAGAMGDHAHGSLQRDQDRNQEQQPAETAAGPASDPADVRLLIEIDPADGGFVYTIVDRQTGAVVRRLPCDRLVEARRSG